jgi:hypothetical protein
MENNLAEKRISFEKSWNEVNEYIDQQFGAKL